MVLRLDSPNEAKGQTYPEENLWTEWFLNIADLARELGLLNILKAMPCSA